ncbi:microtubule Hypothetical protein protein [Nesidiocoris tenuis]|uniref:Calponin-homology (CH) domain-containing protein n=1 Tax=Nesidiocoris tenuis TaxID=355587 RepID=A0ABN7ADH1_9HEMI|nr:microtubule Hypothetical protein protein [Nesidiocoris tenuis]
MVFVMAALRFDIANSPKPAAGPINPEIAELLLAPFSPVPKLWFEKVELGQKAAQFVNIRNPTDSSLSVSVIISKDFADRGFSVNDVKFLVAPHDKVLLEVRFFPLKVGAVRETVSILNEATRLKFIIQISANCVPQQKKIMRKRKTWNTNLKEPFVLMPESSEAISRPPLAAIENQNSFAGDSNGFTNVKNRTFSIPPSPGNGTEQLEVVKEASNSNLSAELEDSLENRSPNPARTEKRDSTPPKKAQKGVFDLSTIDNLNLSHLTPDISMEAAQGRRLMSSENADARFSTPLRSVSSVNGNKNDPLDNVAFSTPADIFPLREAFGSTIKKSEPLWKFISPPHATETSVRARRDLFKKSGPMKARDESIIASPVETMAFATWTLPAQKKVPIAPKPCTSRGSLVGSNYSRLSKSSQSLSGKIKPTWEPTPCLLKRERGGALSPKSRTPFKRSRTKVSIPAHVDSSICDVTTFNDPYVTIYQQPALKLDQYGATTMADPFARNAFHPPDFLEKQTKELIKWVNSVLTPPEEYSAYEAGIDVAELWKKSVASDFVPLAPSREAVCTRYYKDESHLYNLRKTAALLFKSDPIATTLSKVSIKIKSGYLSVKDDLDLHVDQGARYQLVELLMSYNPLWLRIGLEAIYGRVIPLQDKHTVFGLMQFIRNHLLFDKEIDERYSYHNIRGLKKPEFRKEMNDFVVFKFFALIFFLDRAKIQAIIPYDPCLFNKNSPIKESEAIMNQFIKHFVKCVSHMKRTLSSYGYTLDYKQTAIDEYKFACQTYIDLRDGACLARLVEIILKKHNQLVRKLRLPAISRLQKVHNVKLAVEALSNENMSIVDVTPADIVDGHEQKIMSFVWQILFKFLKPRQEKAAITIQLWWRKSQLTLEIRRRINARRYKVLEKAAVRLQALWRGQKLRENFPNLRKILLAEKAKYAVEAGAARKIQLWYRSHLAIKAARREMMNRKLKKDYVDGRKRAAEVKAARTIQNWYFRCVEMRKLRTQFLRQRKSAIVIQKWYRASVAMQQERVNYLDKKQAAVKIQKWYRLLIVARKEHANYKATLSAIRFVQLRYRAILAMRKQRIHFQNQRIAAVRIQQWYRARIAIRQQRYQFHKTIRSVRLIQKWYRAASYGKKERAAYLAQKAAALKIQRWYRSVIIGREQRASYLAAVRAARSIQSWYRARSLMKKERIAYMAQREAILKIQKWFRSCTIARRERTEYQAKRVAVLKIQQWYRACIIAKEERAAYILTFKAIVFIQRWFKATALMKKEREGYLAKRNAALKVQKWFRNCTIARRERTKYQAKRVAVLKIQQWYRACIIAKEERATYILTFKAIVCIQRWFRATTLMKKEREGYLEKRNAALKIQKWFRACKLARDEQRKYQETLRAVRSIQVWYRASLLMKKERASYLSKLEGISKIQIWYRSAISARNQRAEFESIRKSVRVIQDWYRSTSAMKKDRSAYLAQKEAVVVIQKWYRSCIVARTQRSIYLDMLKSVNTIQRWYRATVQMRIDQEAYRQKREAALKIQHWYRSCIATRNLRTDFLLLLKHTKIIQCRFRANKLMKQQVQQYTKTMTAIVKIQKWYRSAISARKQRIQFQVTVKSARQIQKWYRATSKMRKERAAFLDQRTSAMKIQKWYRSCLLTKRSRADYLILLRSVRVVQCRFRATMLARRVAADFERTKAAAVKIERWYRSCTVAKQQRAHYLATLRSAILIQQRYKAKLLMKKDRNEFQTKRMAALKIQRWFRSCIAGRKQRSDDALKVKSAQSIQRWYRTTLERRGILKNLKSLLESNRRAISDARADQAARSIQSWYHSATVLKNERNAFLAKRRAAVKIQRAYRNYRKRVAAAKEGNPPEPTGPTLSQMFSSAGLFFNTSHLKRSLNETYNVFRKLDYITEHSPVLCEKFLDPLYAQIFEVIYFVLDRASRSEAYKVIYGHGMNILIHLARYEKTYDVLWENTKKNHGFEILLILMGKFKEKPEELFCQAATLIWMFSRTPEQIEYIAHTTNIRRQLSYFYKKVIIEPSKGDARKLPGSRTNKALNLPNTKPKWGYSKGSNRGLFSSTKDAVLVLCSTYKIN